MWAGPCSFIAFAFGSCSNNNNKRKKISSNVHDPKLRKPSGRVETKSPLVDQWK